MRKIVYMLTVEEPFAIGTKVVLKEEDSIEILLHEVNDPIKDKYSLADLWKIEVCNRALTSKGYPTMTEDEINLMLKPFESNQKIEESITEEKLQRLAGFEVTKNIRYFNDLTAKVKTGTDK